MRGGAWVHLHSGPASGLRPCLCGTSAAPGGPAHPPGRRRGGGGGSDGAGGVSFAGVLFLQFGEETRRVHITHEVSSLDTLHALIAHMFPQKLTMGMLKSPNTAILIKDEARNVFYELEDVRWAWPGAGWLPRPPPPPGGAPFRPGPLLTQPQPSPLPSRSRGAPPASLLFPALPTPFKPSLPAGSRGLERGVGSRGSGWGGGWWGVLVAGTLRREIH